MRLRTTLVSTASAVALVLTIAGTASAAEGEFSYRYTDAAGETRKAELIDPDNAPVCIEVPEVANTPDAHAFRPRNQTNVRAIGFKASGCVGTDSFELAAKVGRGSDKTLFRSVLFA
ncbi:hypothetical protein AB0A74_04870 [Saccharothrix sp. NPDC042600]|uniref:hypothetical protein n=1 Tax=Saccharothrix TaxID=2071 RepID=UPI0033D0BC31|nr:hypothetical protein GCM10017745_81270 [Saccharothrix mutabilis subsp. capreolus]